MSIQLDALTFQKRIKNLLKFWKEVNKEKGNESEFEGAECLLIPVGESDTSSAYMKGVAVQSWLLQYEFPDTLLLLTPQGMFAYCSNKKASLLEQLDKVNVSEQYKVTCFRRSKDQEESKQQLDSFLSKLSAYKRIGIFKKDAPQGSFIESFNQQYAPLRATITEVDASLGMAIVLAVKDDEEVKTLKKASTASSMFMKNYFIDEMASIIDEEKNITHEKFAEKLENAVFDEKVQRKLQFPSDLDTGLMDWCYTPIIQSGGDFDLKPSAVSNDKNLHSGIITCSLGLRYKNYCSNLGRTFFIDPSKEQEKNYEFLLEVERFALKALKDGVSCSDAYNSVHNYVKEKRPDLEPNFVRNLGFVTGLEFRESNFVLNAKNSRELYENMTVNLIIGFHNLENSEAETKQDKTYALFLSDIFLIGKQQSSCLTSDCSSEFKDVSFFFKGDSDQEQEEKPQKKRPEPKKSAILNTRRRQQMREVDHTAEAKRKQHQKNLMTARLAEGKNRFSEGKGAQSTETQQVFRRYESYKRDGLMPKEVKNGRILVDRRSESLLLPIMGVMVPFHLNSLKNISKNEEGEYIYLRLNFNTPTQTTKKEEILPYDDPNAHFIRSFTFRSSDIGRYSELYKQITELKRDLQKKENERKLKADLVEQDRLVESKRPLAVLQEVNIRPPLEGRKLPGDLQVHSNGLRYHPIRGDQKLDILFSNIKHCFFQPCDSELYVILHFHLKNPIMVGKKKTKDIQVMREATDASIDETHHRRRRVFGDEDELMAEQEERRHKMKLNKEFKQFAERLSEVSEGQVEADVPIRDLGFTGVPHRTNVLLQPTTDCLVHLSEIPFTVISMSDIEIAYLERVQFHLKNFDIVFVYKDFSQTPLHINTIPMNQLEHVKEWLDSIDIPFVEGPLNLNWANIMKNINEDPLGFYEEGGWQNLISEGEESEEGSDEDSASEYEMSEDEEEEEEESEESEFEEEEEESDFEDESDEGEDWDEMEEKAAKSSRKRKSVQQSPAGKKKRR